MPRLGRGEPGPYPGNLNSAVPQFGNSAIEHDRSLHHLGALRLGQIHAGERAAQERPQPGLFHFLHHAAAARQLGFVPTHGLGAALEMAHGRSERPPRIGFLLAPPYFPLRVAE